MNLRRNNTLLLFLSSFPFTQSACPQSTNPLSSLPDDPQHQKLLRGRRLATLTTDSKTRSAIFDVISNRRRSLQSSEFTCLSTAVYDMLQQDVANVAAAITDFGDRGHFLGALLRLAAHDFMDYDKDALNTGGPDGCLDLSHSNNGGLTDVWCDDIIACPFKGLFDEVYSTVMSRADYWVAGANAVVKYSSEDRLVLPFKWGRVSSDICTESSDRLPADDGCSAVEGVFINRMGLTWTDAVALLGGHTLGRGHEQFSGHPGTWVESAEESTKFNNGYYTELLNRPWRPRQLAAGVDWTWGGANRDVMFLNADICLYFDIPDGNEQGCCTNTARDCRDFFQDVPCNDTSIVRPEAKAAVDEFARRRNDDAPFFAAFTSAWEKATELGHVNLNELQATCVPTAMPTTAPTVSTAPSKAPVTLPPTATCRDVSVFLDGQGRERDCAWALERGKCGRFSNECPVTCNACDTATAPSPTATCKDVSVFLDGEGRERDCAWALEKMKCGKFSNECPVTCNTCETAT